MPRHPKKAVESFMTKLIDLFIANDLKPNSNNEKVPVALYVEAESDNAPNIKIGTVVGVKDAPMFSTTDELEVEKQKLFQVVAIVRGICMDDSDAFFQNVYLIDGAFLPMNYDESNENETVEEETAEP